MEDRFDKEEVVEMGRNIRDKSAARIAELYKQNGNDTDEETVRQQIETKYLGKIKFIINGQEVEKHIFGIRREGYPEIRIYDENFDFIGIKMGVDEDIILSETLTETLLEFTGEKQQNIRKTLKEKDWEKAKALEQMEEEQKQVQKDKEEQISNDLSQSIGKDGLKISSYRRIVDNVFPHEFPETCSGAKEVGMARLEDGTFMLVADYGNGFEMAKGTEPARPTMEQVYDIDRGEQTLEKKSPHAIMKVSGNGNRSETKELTVTFGSYGYIEMQVVDRTPDNTRVGRDVREQGEGIKEEKTLSERQLEAEQGVDAARNIADLVSGQENEENNLMKKQIVESVLQSHEEELEGLYGEGPEQEAAIRRYIEEAVTRRGIIIPEDIQRFVEDSLEADYAMNNRGRQHP